jgi:hypothetical protein
MPDPQTTKRASRTKRKSLSEENARFAMDISVTANKLAQWVDDWGFYLESNEREHLGKRYRAIAAELRFVRDTCRSEHAK